MAAAHDTDRILNDAKWWYPNCLVIPGSGVILVAIRSIYKDVCLEYWHGYED